MKPRLGGVLSIDLIEKGLTPRPSMGDDGLLSIFMTRKVVSAKFPHSPILHYVCRSLLTENNDENYATAVGLYTV